MNTIRSKRAGALALVLTLLLVPATAAATSPSVSLSALSVNASGVTGFLASRSVGDAATACFRNAARKPSYGCFYTALRVSGLADWLASRSHVTVLAPTDAAFAHLADTAGVGEVQAFVEDRQSAAAFIRASVVDGVHTLGSLAVHSAPVAASTTLTTVGGTRLSIAFGDVGYGASWTSVDVGSADAVDGQSFVIGTPVLFGDGNLLIPLGRVTIASLSG